MAAPAPPIKRLDKTRQRRAHHRRKVALALAVATSLLGMVEVVTAPSASAECWIEGSTIVRCDGGGDWVVTVVAPPDEDPPIDPWWPPFDLPPDPATNGGGDPGGGGGEDPPPPSREQFGCWFDQLSNNIRRVRVGSYDEPSERFEWSARVECGGGATVDIVHTGLRDAGGREFAGGDSVTVGHAGESSGEYEFRYLAQPQVRETEVALSFTAFAPEGRSWLEPEIDGCGTFGNRMIRCEIPNPRTLKVEVGTGMVRTGVEDPQCFEDTNWLTATSSDMRMMPDVRWCAWSPRNDSGEMWTHGAIKSVDVRSNATLDGGRANPDFFQRTELGGGNLVCDEAIALDDPPRVTNGTTSFTRSITTTYRVIGRWKTPGCEGPSVVQPTLRLERTYMADGTIVCADRGGTSLPCRVRTGSTGRRISLNSVRNAIPDYGSTIWPAAGVSLNGSDFTLDEDRVLITQGPNQYLIGSAGNSDPIHYVSENQFNLPLPAELLPGPADVRAVDPDGIASDAVTIAVAPPPPPEIYDGGVVNPGANFTADDFQPGSVITVVGEFSPQSGRQLLVSQGGQEHTIRAGSVAWFERPHQINARLPVGLQGGPAQLRVRTGTGAVTEPVTIDIEIVNPEINPDGVVNPYAGYTPAKLKAGGQAVIRGKRFTPTGDTVIVTQGNRSYTLGPDSRLWGDNFNRIFITLPDELLPGSAQVRVVSITGRQSAPQAITIVGPTIDVVGNPGDGFKPEGLQPGMIVGVKGDFFTAPDRKVVLTQGSREYVIQRGSAGWYESDAYIALQLPADLQIGTAQMQVRTGTGLLSPAKTINVVVVDPVVLGVVEANSLSPDNIRAGQRIGVPATGLTPPHDTLFVTQGSRSYTLGPSTPMWADTPGWIFTNLPADLQPGTAQVQVRNINGRLSQPRNFTVAGPTINSVVNPGANNTSNDIQPGSVVDIKGIFGTVSQSGRKVLVAQGNQSYTLEGPSIWLDVQGVVRAKLPATMQAGPAELRVQLPDGTTSAPKTINLAIVDPVITEVRNPSVEEPDPLDSNIRAGQVIHIRGTGFTPRANTVIVTQGTNSYEITPTSDDFNQVNVTLPATLQPGSAQLKVRNVNGRISALRTITIVA